MITIYGIRNCDTVKKSLKWFDDRHIAYHFHDFKKQGLDEPTLNDWLERFGWEKLINRQGTTWRKLALTAEAMADPGQARAIILQNLSLIRRPLVLHSEIGALVIGFEPALWIDVAGVNSLADFSGLSFNT
ncbi:MAG: Spx/MgsR family RNA polymerase-binding regulatory protein [Fluviicoccus sp.]|uniref:Spx/MgsR family RNA polymerase-binding regulatory protein n=1 Tax=Fluviicoccus sp. TaxID=2003552 RepID=UPI00272680A9|nr:Spx/MgsR family RNA polymerase-binding regulatory protein [Fluviicoccus sp.]MDO8330842.1 Spx/MgsR family RNA polymerase-binding regulatory protein [Fluviicoccus sp.]